MVYCHLFVLFLAAVAALANAELSSNAEEIQTVLQQLLASKAGQHVSNDHDHDFHHNYDDHKRTNIDPLNLVFKHNKIVPTGELSKPIRNIGEGSGKLVKVGDMLSKLGMRCGCGSNAGRCGIGPDDIPCLDHDHTLDDVILVKHNPDYIKTEYKNHHSNKYDKKILTDPTIVKLLDNLENSLLVQSNGNQNTNDLSDIELLYDKARDDDVKKTDVYLEALLKDLENPLDDTESYDETHKAHLRCCRNCARKSFYRNRDDDRAYLRCCKKCGNKRYSRTDDRDQGRDRSDSNPLGKAKVFHINNDLDAVVLDVSDLNNVFNLMNNGNNLDKSNSIRDFTRLINVESESKHKTPKYENRLQKKKLKDLYRRNSQSGKPQYGVPFELDVQGLGQVNP